MVVASAQPIVFVLPEGHATISGGHLYNAKLLAALEQQCELRLQGVLEWTAAQSAPGLFLIDSLNLREFVAYQAKRIPGQRFVLLAHHLPSLEPGLDEKDGGLALEADSLGLFDAFVATSEFTAEHLRALGHEQPSLVLEPAISWAEVERREFALPLRGLMSCNLIARKGVLAFLKGLADSTSPDDEYQIDIVGRLDLDPDYSAACQECIRSSPSLRSRVTLRGEAQPAAMASWYGGANLFLSASQMETFGISLQEARHFGLPIFAVHGGNSENHLVRGKTGEIFDEPGALAEGFLSLVRSKTRLRSYWGHAQAQDFKPGSNWQNASSQLVRSLEKWFPC